MNTYPSFPTCLDNEGKGAERVNLKSPNPTSHLTIQSPFSQTYRTRLWDTHYSAFIEAAFSPAKYALFQMLGNAFLKGCGSSHFMSTTSRSAKVGCIGGTTLTILYLVLLVARAKPHVENSDNDDLISENPHRSLEVITDEVFYSTVASAIGAFVYQMTGQIDLLTHMLAGAIGPILFLSIFFAIVGVVWCISRLIKKFMDWYTGY